MNEKAEHSLTKAEEKRWGKTPPYRIKSREAIDEAVENSRIYMNRLIAVAIAANEVIAGAKKVKHNRYYFRVAAKRFNVLRRSLETLGKQHQR